VEDQVTASMQTQPSDIQADRLLQMLSGTLRNEWNAELILLVHSKYPRANESGDLWDNRDGKEVLTEKRLAQGTLGSQC
jgi:hypothetical protein